MLDAKILQKLAIYQRLMRLDKPIGILLLLWPTLWALWMASQGQPDGRLLMVFVMGTVLMRSAGCVMNDIADSQYDGLVERTQFRPLAQQELSKKEALLLAAGLSALAFALVCTLNGLTIALSLVALFLAMTYPLTKRFLAIPQAYLGIAFAWGIPMAFAASTGSIPPLAWVLLLANVCWAMAYDTEYAMVDRDDDLKIGIKSSAISFGRFDVVAVMLCYLCSLLLLVLAGQLAKLGCFYYLGLGLAGGVALRHYFLIRHREKARCFQAFLHNNWFGFAVFAGLAAHYYVS